MILTQPSGWQNVPQHPLCAGTQTQSPLCAETQTQSPLYAETQRWSTT